VKFFGDDPPLLPEEQSQRLKSYLVLEREMMTLDEAGEDALADAVRDCLDAFNDALGERERRYLRSRGNLSRNRKH
jgi:hypothetical protein